MLRLPGGAVFADPRFEHDEHTHCPEHESDRPWLRRAVEAHLWSREGRPLRDYEPRPSAGLIEAVLLLDAEARALEADMMRRQADEARSGGH